MILSVVTVLFWIIFGVIRLLREPTEIKNVPEEIISPLTPTLDIGTLRKIENSLFFSDEEIGVGNISDIDFFPSPEPEEVVEEIVEEIIEEVEEVSTESGETI